MKTILLLLLFISTLFAELKVGDNFPSLVLIDQFNNDINISKLGEQRILFSFEKKTSLEMQEYLKAQDRNFLMDNKMVYISDISSIPSFFSKIFVLPQLRELTFSVALMYEKSDIEHQSKKLTLIKLEENNVVEIQFIDALNIDKF